MKRLLRTPAARFLAGALAVAAACSRRPEAERGAALPGGDGVWLTEGLGTAESEAETEQILSRGGFSRVFLPLCRVDASLSAVEEAPPPARPIPGPPVVLVVQAEPGAAAGPGGAEDRLAARIRPVVRRAFERSAAYGRVEGVLLDLPLGARNVEALERLAAGVRSELPRGAYLAATLRFSPSEKERETLASKPGSVDGFAAVVFGDARGADTVSADALGRPWWAVYVPGARGERRDAVGEESAALTEKVFRALSDDPRFVMENDLSVREEGVSGFVFRTGAAVQAVGLRFAPGDRISFRQPLVSELLYRMGSDLAGRRFVRGRVVALDGTAESDRVFALGALSDVILGRPLAPEWHAAVAPDASAIRVSAENRASHASIVSRTANWIEVDVPGGRIRDVQPGEFDRFEMFDPQGRAVTPGRATRVRFYETLVAPFEKTAGAAILLKGRPERDCCRFRLHLLSAGGAELAGDWISPEAPPTPAAAKRR